MRHHIFIALLAAAIVLDLAFLGLGLAQPGARLFQAPAALAAPRPQQVTAAPPRPTPSPTASPTATPSPTPSPTASPTATPSPTVTPSPTATPSPTPLPEPRLLAGKSVSFTPSDRAVRANIRLALGHYAGALAHVVLAPGEVFSFNAALGQHPQGLPWKNVRVKPTASPEGEAAQDQLIQGGGLCDLASRYVMAARPLLPARAFRFVNHVRSNGIRLAGVPARDSVSIWAVGGGKGEQDLTIANTTAGWIEWMVERQGEKITVAARLWDQPPPDS